MSRGTSQYFRLEQRLILLSWLNSQLGYEHNRDLLADMKEATEGFDETGQSYVFHRMKSSNHRLLIPLSRLAKFDKNVRIHLETINCSRSQVITLRYFQYLAALFTEIYLYEYFNSRESLLSHLNDFVFQRNASRPSSKPDNSFTVDSLQKLAFWMATGSGKTLIMHINFWQFLHYNSSPLDNILLITPNEGLSAQHIQDMQLSNIPCQAFAFQENNLFEAHVNKVRVLEITKLVKERQRGGVSVPVEAFEGNNLIFVDEGHKGTGGEAWRRYRDSLGETGFTFEYSATFGQALSATRNHQLTEEYGKSIVFDYSYRYFHGDGHGKDFRVLNLKQETTAERTSDLLMGNLLSFHEQQRVFEESAGALRPYHLERPLWVFVGSTVNAVYSQKGRQHSDVLTVTLFLHKVLRNRSNWAVEKICRLLDGNSGLETPDGIDVFQDKFLFLRQNARSPEQVYQDILLGVFHAPSSGGLLLSDIQGADGELGLKVSSADKYFGLVYIGDTGRFKNLVEESDSGITLEDDVIAKSLFDHIGEQDTTLNVLVGAKKFMEGWNSWRVSNMGLLNIGRNAGSEIIQLFGRGVRLRGKEYSLKRSSVLEGPHPSNLRLLETLDIFAIRANYMSLFQEYLEREGTETESFVEVPVSIRPREAFLQQGLVLPRVPGGRKFVKEEILFLEVKREIQVRVDLSLKVQMLESYSTGVASQDVQAGQATLIPKESLDLIDWEKIYLALLEFKQQRQMTNLVVTSTAPREILEHSEPALYELFVDESVVRPRSFSDCVRIQEAAEDILRKYMEAFYRVEREKWESNHMEFALIDEGDPNLSFNLEEKGESKKGRYLLKIKKSEREFLSEVETLLTDVERLCEREVLELPCIRFDRHLYQPLLTEHGGFMTMNPPGLNQGEKQFVVDLKAYWTDALSHKQHAVEVFLLRNLSRGKGVGFFAERGFYPDFVLWLKKGLYQRIIFLEPHGMIHAPSYKSDHKARLHERLKVLGTEIGARSGHLNISLDSYIVSVTPFKNLRETYDDRKWDLKHFTKAHILFQERDRERGYDYMEVLFAEQLCVLGCLMD